MLLDETRHKAAFARERCLVMGTLATSLSKATYLVVRKLHFLQDETGHKGMHAF